MFRCEKFSMVFSCFVPLLTLFEINCLSFADTDTRVWQAQNRQQALIVIKEKPLNMLSKSSRLFQHISQTPFCVCLA